MSTTSPPNAQRNWRLLTWIIVLAAAGVLVWASEQFEKYKQLSAQRTVLSTQAQALALQSKRAQNLAREDNKSKPPDSESRTRMPSGSEQLEFELKRQQQQLERLSQTIAGWGSDARNATAALERLKALCAQAELKACFVRKSASAAPGNASDLRIGDDTLNAYSFNMLSSFDAVGFDRFFASLSASPWMFRVDKINIVQNRAEWDISLFFIAPSVSSDAASSASTRATPSVASPLATGAPQLGTPQNQSNANTERVWEVQALPTEAQALMQLKLKPEEPLEWWIVGTVRQQDKLCLVLEISKGASPVNKCVGEALPSGARLSRIEANRAWIHLADRPGSSAINLEF